MDYMTKLYPQRGRCSCCLNCGGRHGHFHRQNKPYRFNLRYVVNCPQFDAVFGVKVVIKI